MKNIISSLLISIIVLSIGCKKDDSVTPQDTSSEDTTSTNDDVVSEDTVTQTEDPIVIVTPLTAEDLDVTIAENPLVDQLLGTISATGDNLEFSFVNAKQNLIYTLDTATGDLSVLATSRFDYESNRSLSTEVYVSNGIDTVTSNITINITNVLEVGDLHEGGIIFWIDPDDETEGLVCALNDQSASAPWGCEGTAISGADSKLLGDGNKNTIEIEAGCSTTGTAADLCANLTSEGYSDWYLPTENELGEIYSNIGTINTSLTENQGTAFVRSDGGAPYYNGAYYWSSSEHIAQSAIPFDFSNGNGGITTKSSTHHVRAIRSF